MGPIGPMMSKSWIHLQRKVLGEGGDDERLYVVRLRDGTFMRDSANTAVMAWRVQGPAEQEARSIRGQVISIDVGQYRKLNSAGRL